MEKIKRLQNSPKKYPNKRGDKNPRQLCPDCEKTGKKHYLKKTKCQYMIEGKIRTVTPLSFCLKCRSIVWNEDVLKTIPE